MIAIGCDHGGYELKQEVMKHLEERGVEYKDYGCYTPESIDYSDIAEVVCKAVVDGEAERAFLICGTGIGMSCGQQDPRHPRGLLFRHLLREIYPSAQRRECALLRRPRRGPGACHRTRGRVPRQ